MSKRHEEQDICSRDRKTINTHVCLIEMYKCRLTKSTQYYALIMGVTDSKPIPQTPEKIMDQRSGTHMV